MITITRLWAAVISNLLDIENVSNLKYAECFKMKIYTCKVDIFVM